MDIINIGENVCVRGTNQEGEVIKSELKIFSYINNGKQIRMITVKLKDGSEMEYQIDELRKIN